jgi:hypothetical protein
MKKAFFAAVIGAFVVIVAVPAAANVKLGETRYFKNWAAGCDNVQDCEAVAMLPPELPEGMLSLVLSRSAGASGDLKINIFGFDSESDRYQLFVDNKLASVGAITNDIAPISVTDRDALKLARLMAAGKEARVVDAAGKLIGKISLAGSSAALRYLDISQQRARTAGALILRGKRKMRAKAIEPPVIAASRIVPANDIPSASELVALAESGSCAEERVGVTQDAVYGLGIRDGKPRVLSLISCGNGAYNFSSAAYFGTKNKDNKWVFAPAKFDYDSGYRSEKGDVNLISNASWSAATQMLSTFSKSRGIGDCGHSADYVWDGNMFRLTHARSMEECQGSVDWITVWRANVKFVD